MQEKPIETEYKESMDNPYYLAEIGAFLENRGIKNVQDLEQILQPSYFVVLPIDVLERKDLNPTTKMLYGEINALSRKSGRCFATNKYIGERLGIAERTITRGIKELFNKKLIRIEAQITPRGTCRNLYVVYNEINNVCGNGSTKRLEGVDKLARGGRQVGERSIRNRYKEIENNTAARGAALKGEGSMINEAMQGFESVNPSYTRLYPNKAQREALGRLIRAHGLEKVKSVIEFLPKSNAHKFAPTITTPLQLEARLGDLFAWAQKQRGGSEKGKEFII